MIAVVRGVVVALLGVHALLHLLGVAKGLGWAEVAQLQRPIGVAAGVGWLVAALLVLSAAVMLAVGAPAWWWVVALVAAAVSQTMVVTSWSDAKAGTIPNAVLVLVAVLGLASVGPVSLQAAYDSRVREVLAAAPAPRGTVGEADLATLPPPVAAYVRRSGAVGRPRVVGFTAQVHGRIRSTPDTPWMPFAGRQVDVFGPEPQRLFLIRATRSGLPVTVLHDYRAGSARMRGRLAGLVTVFDSTGPAMDRGETVTVLNDLVVFAPAALVDAPIEWSTLDDHRVGATYTAGGHTVSAVLLFDADGDLADFVSEDRSRASEDGTSFDAMPWSTPLTGHRELDGRRVATGGEGLWHPAGEPAYAYVDFHVDDLHYDLGAAGSP